MKKLIFIKQISFALFTLFFVSDISAQNLALGKPTKQSSTAFGGDSGRAVDGNKDGNYFNNSMTHTADESSAWWEVDLGAVYDLDRIVVWNRTDDCCWERLQNFLVITSAKPFFQNSTGGMNGDGYINRTHNAWTKGKKSVTFDIAGSGQPSKARYVRINLIGEVEDRPLSLAEVEVFAATPLLAVGTLANVGEWNASANKWDDKGRMGGWTLKMLTSDSNGDMWSIGTGHNVGKWNASTSKWEDKGHMGGWTMKMITFDSKGDMWGVGTEHNIGKWNESTGKWENKGLMGDWTMKMITFDSNGDMWGVGTSHNIGKWNASTGQWEDKGQMGGWSIDWISLNSK